MSERKEAAIILTGATGFLGGHLMAALVWQGQRLVILGRASESACLADRVSRLLGWFGLADQRELVETEEADTLQTGCGLEGHRYRALCAKAGAIIHCASDTRFSEKRRQEVTEANINGLRGILDLAVDSRVPFFHYVSTAYVAGKISGVCREELVQNREFTNIYEETKARAEHEVASRCGQEGIPYTIIRPSIVYGDSRTGRSTRFNALYYPVKSLSYLREIYWDDIQHHGGQRAHAHGIAVEDGGTLRLPLRVFLSRRGHVNLIPIDYFVSAVLAVLERPEAGAVYHLTSDSPKTIDELSAYCQTYLRIKGIEIVDGTPEGAELNPPEAMLQRFLEPYLPYLADNRQFDRSQADRATHGQRPPEFTYEIFERCMNYAVSVNWGNGGPGSFTKGS